MDYQPFCENLARKAGALMKTNFSLGMKKAWKGDGSPVTKTDKAINAMVLEAVQKAFPEHSILAEEGSNLIEGSEYTWVCDPIDGTIPFSHGIPTSVFALALTHHGVVEYGILYDPFMDRMMWAEKGKGAYLNAQRIHISAMSTLEHATVNIETWRASPYYLATLQDVVEIKNAITISLCSVMYGGMLVASGEFVADIFTGAGPHDGAALKIIVEEAGGKMTDLFGKEQRYDQPIRGYIASNGHVHEELLAMVKATMQKRE